MPESGYFSIHKTVRQKPPRLPFPVLKEKVLGSRYGLSLVFVGDDRSRSLNRRYRGKDKPANVLAFPLSASEGEIFLNLTQARRDAPRFGLSHRTFTAKLFIHAMLHLKGYRHGGTMNHAEQAILATLPSQR
jgi:rRNA maturation RNase YbeY